MKKTIVSILTALTVMVIISINCLTVLAAAKKNQQPQRQLIITEKGHYTFNIRTEASKTSKAKGSVSTKDFPIPVLDEATDNSGTIWYKIGEKKWIISSRVIKVEEVSASKNTQKTTSTTTTKKTTTATKATKTTTSTTKTNSKTTATSKKRQLVMIEEGQYTFTIRSNHSSTSKAKGSVSSKDFPILVLDEAKDENGKIWYKIKENSWIISSRVIKVEKVSASKNTQKTTSTTNTKKTTTTTSATATAKTTTKKSNTTDHGKKMFSSSYSTNYGNSNKGRKQNIKVTCDYLDGIAIKPGENFNWFTMMPTTTKAHGYTMATIFKDGKAVQGMGGGLCQVTSTLYNVCLDLEEKGLVKITARKPHGLPVSYVPPGRDATISRSGKKNFCFKDTSDCILVISAKANGRKCTVTITGYEVKNKKN